MAHELEQDSNGNATFVSANGLDAWHRLGTVLPGGLTADQALEAAFLKGWDVRKVPNLTTLHYDEVIDDDGVTPARDEIVEVPGQFTIVRNNPFTKMPEVLGNPGASVGTKYTAFQNDQATEFLAAITDEYSDAQFETAGSIRQGTQVFVSMRLKDFKVGGVDAINMYLVYLLNHTTGANQCFPTNIRPVCANTVDWALQGARYVFRHSASIETRHQEARDALRLAFNYDAKFQASAEAMLAQKLELDAFRALCREIWPEPEKEAPEATRKSHDRQWQQLKNLFVFADTQEEIRFTKWGAFNAIVEYQDHVAGSRGTSDSEKADARALRVIDQTQVAQVPIKNRAFELLNA